MRYLFLKLPLTLIALSTQGSEYTFHEDIRPILEFTCYECHSGKRPEAGFNIEQLTEANDPLPQHHDWFKVADQIEIGAMPPADQDPLDVNDKKALLGWIRSDLANQLISNQRVNGRSRIRRLSQSEYANSVQDIFGIRPPTGRFLPPDSRVDGYTKVSQALPFSPTSTDGYLQLAELIISRLFELPKGTQTTRLWADKSWQSPGNLLELPNNWVVSFNSDPNSGNLRPALPDGSPGGGRGIHVRKPGHHRLKINAYGYQTDRPLAVGIYSGHITAYPQILSLMDIIEIPPAKPSIVETELYLPSNKDAEHLAQLRLIPFGLGVPVPKNALASEDGVGAGMALQWVDIVELEATLNGQDLIFGQMPESWMIPFQRNRRFKAANIPEAELQSTVSNMISRIGYRLYRRELTKAEIASHVDSFMKAIAEETGLRDALVCELTTLLTSPDFLCLITRPGKLDAYTLASRLSYFLWNSAPDEELLKLAKSGSLLDSDVLHSQADRLLNGEQSQRFVDNFLDQWLNLWAIDETSPDKDLYPDYDTDLKLSSQMEVRAAFKKMLVENRSVRDFVNPSWAMVNERLAKVYQLPNVDGFSIRSVALPPKSPFGGFLTQAAVMKVTANGTTTSPIKRGVWLSDRLLGISIPPPPGDIEPVEPDIRGAKTLREQLSKHSQSGNCKACHSQFDPYGFALESFDVMGNYRENYRVWDKSEKKWIVGLPVDSSGITPNNQPFGNIQQLRKLLTGQPEQLARGLVRHLLTYSTGEPASPIDQPTIEAIVAGAKSDNYGIRSLIHSLIQNEVFQYK